MFRDYASEKLGIPENRIKNLVDDGADERQFCLALRTGYLARSNKNSLMFTFSSVVTASHRTMEKMYLLPYDGAPELLDDTAIARERPFSRHRQPANPTLRDRVPGHLLFRHHPRPRHACLPPAQLPFAPSEQAIPEGLLVMTAAAEENQTEAARGSKARHVQLLPYEGHGGGRGRQPGQSDYCWRAARIRASKTSSSSPSGSQTPRATG